jgi:hypothetical protein
VTAPHPTLSPEGRGKNVPRRRSAAEGQRGAPPALCNAPLIAAKGCTAKGRLRGLERPQHPCSDIRRNRLQSSDEASQKACGVVIRFVQRQPGNRSFTNSDPFAD